MAKKKDAKKDKPVEVVIPDAKADRPAWAQVGIFAAVGLVIGVAWPSLAGIHIGPSIPGSKKPDAQPTPSAATATPSAVSSAAVPAAKPAPAAEVLDKQLVVVSGGTIEHCFAGRDRLEGDACGKLVVDRLLVPRLEKLDGCPSALGLAGEMGIRFDVDFKKQEIAVRKGETGEVPNSTVNGIMACVADYIADVSADKIPHKHDKYRIKYDLSFHPPGTAPPRSGQDEAAEDDADDERGFASVSWDTGLIRDEPRTGKVVARVVRGTRVRILGRRKDWYRVKIRSKEGWLYRGALGL